MPIGNLFGFGTKKSAPDTGAPAASPAATPTPVATPATQPIIDATISTPLAAGLAATAPAPTAAAGQPGEVIQKIAQELKAKGENVIDLIKTPTKMTSVSATYKFGSSEGRMLNPGEELLLELPAHLRERAIRAVILVHRQDAAHDTGREPGQKWDKNPGLTAVNLHSIADGTWRQWNSPWGSSGKWGAKFAETRSAYDPEFELEFDWHIRGHQQVDGGYGTGGADKKLKADAARVASVGTDPVFLHEVTIQVLAETPTQIKEAIFCEGTVFGDWETGSGRKFGGGQSFQGTFPGGLELRGYGDGGEGKSNLPEGWSMANGLLEVSLDPGKIVTGVDIACGDSHPDKIKNGDGGWGTPGWSRLSMGIKRADGPTEWFMERQGVPPEGVLSGAPVAVGYQTKPGDKLVVKAESDTTYVMGLRVGLRD